MGVLLLFKAYNGKIIINNNFNYMIIKQYLRLFYVYNNIRRLALKDMDANTMHKICSHFFFSLMF